MDKLLIARCQIIEWTDTEQHVKGQTFIRIQEIMVQRIFFFILFKSQGSPVGISKTFHHVVTVGSIWAGVYSPFSWLWICFTSWLVHKVIRNTELTEKHGPTEYYVWLTVVVLKNYVGDSFNFKVWIIILKGRYFVGLIDGRFVRE